MLLLACFGGTCKPWVMCIRCAAIYQSRLRKDENGRRRAARTREAGITLLVCLITVVLDTSFWKTITAAKVGSGCVLVIVSLFLAATMKYCYFRASLPSGSKLALVWAVTLLSWSTRKQALWRLPQPLRCISKSAEVLWGLFGLCELYGTFPLLSVHMQAK